MAASQAIALKEQGNKRFQAGDYKGAEELYTKAISKDPSNAFLFTNRAFSRLKMQHWDGVLNDSLKSIELLPANMKGYYYLAQAQLALNHPNEALNSALTAYDEALKNKSSSAQNISSLVLSAKKAKWERRENERMRRANELLAELERALQREKETLLAEAREHRMDFLDTNNNDNNDGAAASRSLPGPTHTYADELADIEAEYAQKTTDLHATFAAADPAHCARRAVPDYLIDSISFAIMHDPVVTRTGHSYERSTILEHLRRSPTDPLTREPLRPEDLRPNLALRAAAEEFLEANGWAVDW